MTNNLPDEVIRVRPEGPPSKLKSVGPEVAFRAAVGSAGDVAMLRNVSEPTLSVFGDRHLFCWCPHAPGARELDLNFGRARLGRFRGSATLPHVLVSAVTARDLPSR